MAAQPLRWVALGGAIFLGLTFLLVIGRAWLLAGREIGAGPTWDCGYAEPRPSMQYTASSFAQPLTSLFRLVLRTETHARPLVDLFPPKAALVTETPDAFREAFFRPAFATIGRTLERFRLLQHGRTQLYVLYVVVTLIALIAWKLR